MNPLDRRLLAELLVGSSRYSAEVFSRWMYHYPDWCDWSITVKSYIIKPGDDYEFLARKLAGELNGSDRS